MMKKIFLCTVMICVFQAVAIEQREETARVSPKTWAFIKGVGFGLTTGAIGGIADIKAAQAQTCPPIFSFVVEPITRRVVIKKMNMSSEEEQLFGWAAWGASWCGLWITTNLYNDKKIIVIDGFRGGRIE